MSRRLLSHGSPASALTFALTLAAAGCASVPDARYVYQDGEFGVIGVPLNTPYGRKDFMKQAHGLMAAHFPDGYEIVRAEEVVEGQRFLDAGRKTEIATEPTIRALDQMIKLGRLAETRSIEQKDALPITESRIIYRRRRPEGPSGANGFSNLATSTPPLYLDPNEMTRCKASELIAEVKLDEVKKNDPGMKKVGHETTTK